MSRYREIDVNDIAKVAPPGYKLAVWTLPFSRKFALTWWIDENGKLGRRSNPYRSQA